MKKGKIWLILLNLQIVHMKKEIKPMMIFKTLNLELKENLLILKKISENYLILWKKTKKNMIINNILNITEKKMLEKIWPNQTNLLKLRTKSY